MSEGAARLLFGWKLTNRQLIAAIGIPVVIVLAGLGLWLNAPASNATPAGESPEVNRLTADPESQRKVMPVQVSRLNHVSSIEQTRAYTGMIRSKQKSEIGFEMTGRITDMPADEGSRVKKDDVLASIDTSALVARKATIQAELDRANQVLNELIAGPRQEVKAAARADVRAAQSQLKLAEDELERNERLVGSGGISQLEFDRSRFALDAARSEFESATQRLAELDAGTRSEQKEAQRAAVRALEASRAEVDVSIEKSEIIAPFDGVITRRFVDSGSIAVPGSPVFRIVDDRNLEAWIGLPVEITAEIGIGNTYPLHVDATTAKAECTAKISEIDPSTRTQTMVFKIKPDPETGQLPAVVSGQLCQIEISSDVPESGFWIPNEALTSGVRGLWAVFVAVESPDGWRVERHDVELLKTDVGRSLCEGALSDGDYLIVGGTHKITAGQQITFEKPE